MPTQFLFFFVQKKKILQKQLKSNMLRNSLTNLGKFTTACGLKNRAIPIVGYRNCTTSVDSSHTDNPNQTKEIKFNTSYEDISRAYYRTKGGVKRTVSSICFPLQLYERP